MDDRAAIEAIRAETNERARAALIEAFVTAKEPLVRILAEKYARIEKTAAALEDIHQAGRIGLIKALESWDHTQGSLSTWAGWKIRRAVQDLAHTEQPIKLPQIRGTTAERERVMRAVRERHDVTAAELGVPEGMLERVKGTMNLRFVSVDMFASDSDDDAPRRARRIERHIAGAGTGEPADDVETAIDMRRRVAAFARSASDLGRELALAAEEVVVLVACALGLPPPYAEEAMAATAKKTPPASPHSRQTERAIRCPKPPKTSPPAALTLRRPLRPPPLSLRRDERAGRRAAVTPPSARSRRSLPACAPLRPRPLAPSRLRPLPPLRPPMRTARASSAASPSSRPSKVSRLPSAPRSSRPSAPSCRARAA